MKLLIINGPNMNMLGLREPELYGRRDYAALCNYVNQCCTAEGIECELYQSNHEGDLVDIIQNACGRIDGIVINPAAYTHTSVAIADALRAVAIPAVEVHLTDTDRREEYRKISYTAEACLTVVKGKGFKGYSEAVLILKRHLSGESAPIKDLNC